MNNSSEHHPKPPPFIVENCTACGKPMPGGCYLSYDYPGHFHLECVPLPPRIQAEEDALAKAKTFRELSIPGFSPDASEYPPGLDAMLERLREMAEASKPFHEAKGEADYFTAKEIGKRFPPANAAPSWSFSMDWMSGRLFGAAELLAELEGKPQP